jgi:hypothetical protein
MAPFLFPQYTKLYTSSALFLYFYHFSIYDNNFSLIFSFFLFLSHFPSFYLSPFQILPPPKTKPKFSPQRGDVFSNMYIHTPLDRNGITLISFRCCKYGAVTFSPPCIVLLTVRPTRLVLVTLWLFIVAVIHEFFVHPRLIDRLHLRHLAQPYSGIVRNSPSLVYSKSGARISQHTWCRVHLVLVTVGHAHLFSPSENSMVRLLVLVTIRPNM